MRLDPESLIFPSRGANRPPEKFRRHVSHSSPRESLILPLRGANLCGERPAAGVSLRPTPVLFFRRGQTLTSPLAAVSLRLPPGKTLFFRGANPSPGNPPRLFLKGFGASPGRRKGELQVVSAGNSRKSRPKLPLRRRDRDARNSMVRRSSWDRAMPRGWYGFVPVRGFLP